MLNLTPASFEEFAAEAQRGNVVPVVRTVLADLQTPVGAFLRIAGDAGHAFRLGAADHRMSVAEADYRYPGFGKGGRGHHMWLWWCLPG